MQNPVNRRDFLLRMARLGLAISGANYLLSAVGCGTESARPIVQAGTVAPPLQAAPTAGATTNAATPQPVAGEGGADLAVVQGASVQAITREAVNALGGIDRYVPRGSKVVIKPNICISRAPEFAVTTHPDVVAALVLMCREAGASKVTVLDFGFGGLNAGYVESGIEPAVRDAGGTMERISMMKFKKTDAPRGKEMHQFAIYQDVVEADVIISAPIAKHHNLAGITLGMKNMMGVINSREALHGNIGQRVADLCTVVRPTLTVIDATRILLRNGPTGGNLNDVKKLDTVVASADIVAADSYGTTLFGQQGRSLATVRAGEEMGLGTSDLSKLRIARLRL